MSFLNKFLRPNKFSGLSVKLYAMIVLAMIGVIGVSLYGLKTMHHDLYDAKRSELRHLVQSAASVIQSYEKEVKSGKLTREAAQKLAVDAISRARYEGSGYFFILTMKGVTVSLPPKPNLTGEDISGLKDVNGFHFVKEMIKVTARDGQGFVHYFWPKLGAEAPQPKLSYTLHLPQWGWFIGTGVYLDDLEAHFFDVMLKVGLIALLVLGGLIFATTLLAKRITDPMKQLTQAMSLVSSGSTKLSIPCSNRHDEIGAMASALEILRDNTAERQRLENAAALERQERDRRQSAIETMILEFKADVQDKLSGVSQNAERMETTSKHMADFAADTSGQSQKASEATDLTSSNVETMAAATEQMTASIQDIRFQVGRNTDLIKEASQVALETDQKIASLMEGAQSIGKVVSLIQDIAEQTNLLALNATIEAARAGDAGKGFAVVATEVKSLATQTSKATEDISSQISSIQQRTNEAVEAIQDISGRMSDVNNNSSSITTAIEEQSIATSEITETIQSAAIGTRQVKEAVNQMKRSVTETKQSADQVLSVSGEVAGQAHDMRYVVTDFLEKVAAL